jgi:hypothetical protein
VRTEEPVRDEGRLCDFAGVDAGVSAMATVSATEASLGIAAPQVKQKRLPSGMRLAHDGHCIMAFALLFGIVSHGASALLVNPSHRYRAISVAIVRP